MNRVATPALRGMDSSRGVTHSRWAGRTVQANPVNATDPNSGGVVVVVLAGFRQALDEIFDLLFGERVCAQSEFQGQVGFDGVRGEGILTLDTGVEHPKTNVASGEVGMGITVQQAGDGFVLAVFDDLLVQGVG